jgi:hypothetical protein
MKQVLFVGAGQQFPKGPFAFLNSMQQEERVHARALFFKPVDQGSLVAVAMSSGLTPILQLDEKEEETIAIHKTLFAKECAQNNIGFSIHESDQPWDRNLLVRESRFADLILISGELFFADTGTRQPNAYLQETLHAAECPVLIVPETFSSIGHLFMAYDGSRESCYAIKQFCYLFPNLADLPTEIVYIKDEADQTIPELDNLKQFSRLKFNSMSFSKLHFKAAEYFATWISERQHVLLVTGSFGRSPFSYLAHRSFAEDVIRDHQLPIFIAHH